MQRSLLPVHAIRKQSMYFSRTVTAYKEVINVIAINILRWALAEFRNT
jgi:hypothetical protein